MNNFHRIGGGILLALFAAASIPYEAWSEAPNILTYQGRLRESSLPVTGNRVVDVRLCPALTGGGCISSGEQGVSVANGLFRTTFTVPGGVNLATGDWYLEIALGAAGATVLTPRERLGSTPYALHASSAAANVLKTGDTMTGALTLTGPAGNVVSGASVTASAFFGDGSALTGVTAGTVADGSVTTAKLADDSVTSSKIRGDALLPLTLDRGNGRVGIGVTAPGEALDIREGNILMLGDGEQEIRMYRSDLADDPRFKLGRIILAGDGSPEFRVLYEDDVTAEGSVFEFDSKGIVASVHPPGANAYGSHFEGFVRGEVNPLFRLNSFPAMQLEMGAGGSTPTDVAVRRSAVNTLSLLTGDKEWVRVDGLGQVGVSTGLPQARLHVSSGTGETGNLLLVSTGTTNLFRVTGEGEAYAHRFLGDGSGLTGVLATDIADGAVTSDKIAANSIQTAKLADGAVTTSKLHAEALDPAGHLLLQTSGGNVGIGTADPRADLEVVGGVRASSGIVSIGSVGGVVTEGASDRFMWVPSLGAIRAGGGGVNEWDAANIGAYSVAFGTGTRASGLYSTVGGGQSNIASNSRTTVGGGASNTASGFFATVGGGITNTASSSDATVGGAPAMLPPVSLRPWGGARTTLHPPSVRPWGEGSPTPPPITMRP